MLLLRSGAVAPLLASFASTTSLTRVPRPLPTQAPNLPKYPVAASAVLLSSNSNAANQAAIVDGNDTTAWQSGANLPT